MNARMAAMQPNVPDVGQSEGARNRRFNWDRMQHIQKLFQKMDLDGNGTITCAELRVLWKIMFPELSQDQLQREVERTFMSIDTDQNGAITWEEMVDYLDDSPEADGMADLLCDDEDDTLETEPKTRREWLWALFEYSSATGYVHPGLRNASLLVQLVMQSAILASVTVMMTETLPELVSCPDPSAENNCHFEPPIEGRNSSDWRLVPRCGCESGNTATFVAEAICIAFFTVEFVVRFCATPSQTSYWTSAWTWIDLVSVLPFYLTLFKVLPGDSGAGALVVLRVLRLARLARVLRMLRLGKNFKSIQVMIVALMRARIALVLMCVLMLMTIVFYSSLMFFLERRDCDFNPTPAPGYPHGRWVRNNHQFKDHGEAVFFQSIPDTMWWGLATVTTVGYGDVYPITPEGKFIASLCMVTGILVVSYPITILTNAFATVNEEFREEESRKKRKDEFRLRLMAAANDDTPNGFGIGVAAPSPTSKRRLRDRPALDASVEELRRGASTVSTASRSGLGEGSGRLRFMPSRAAQLAGANLGEGGAAETLQSVVNMLQAQASQQGVLLRRLALLEQEQKSMRQEMSRCFEALGCPPSTSMPAQLVHTSVSEDGDRQSRDSAGNALAEVPEPPEPPGS
eukprot:TRINITY_DN19561_c0_g1_i1.p1 TRINITY_DN19561_c0_g1~~TRINITY_DN19561_c0_g1_i1.p1  ORF type:complete len:630 (+),score=164.93 TRINITY_DN19561_c0_g1_i1:210-2099(+)